MLAITTKLYWYLGNIRLFHGFFGYLIFSSLPCVYLFKSMASLYFVLFFSTLFFSNCVASWLRCRGFEFRQQQVFFSENLYFSLVWLQFTHQLTWTFKTKPCLAIKIDKLQSQFKFFLFKNVWMFLTGSIFQPSLPCVENPLAIFALATLNHVHREGH